MKIGVVIAMQKELELFAHNLQGFSELTLAGKTFLQGKIDDKEITIVVAGMGKVNAAIFTTYLIEHFKADVIINIGISGGLSSTMQIGDFVVGKDIVYHDVWCEKPNAYGQIQDMPLFYHSAPEFTAKLADFQQGLLCCGDKFVTSTEDIQAIKGHFPSALAVDMESAAIAQTCYIHNIPLLCIRQISDVPSHENQIEQYYNFWNVAPQNSYTMFQKIVQLL